MTSPTAPATAGAVACAGAAVLIAAATSLITFGLAESYGFGPGWDWSAFGMTGAAAVLTGAAVVGAVRLARLRMRAFLALGASVATVFAVAYVAGVLGNHLHQ